MPSGRMADPGLARRQAPQWEHFWGATGVTGAAGAPEATEATEATEAAEAAASGGKGMVVRISARKTRLPWPGMMMAPLSPR